MIFIFMLFYKCKYHNGNFENGNSRHCMKFEGFTEGCVEE